MESNPIFLKKKNYLFIAIFLLTFIVKSYGQYLPLSGGTLTGSLNMASGTQIQTPYLGFNNGFTQPSTSGNVAIFPNNSTGALDIIGWTNGWRFVPGNTSSYMVPVVKIDPNGTTYVKSLFTSGNNIINIADPHAADIVIGSDVGARHDGSIMWWSNASASRISNTAEVFYFSIWNSSIPNIGLSAANGGTSYFKGNILIGQTTQSNAAYKLDVAGNMRANQITVNATGADFVFGSTYRLLSLANLERYLVRNHHLPEMPSAKQMKTDGLNVGENQIKLLQKVEELTLYLIEQHKQIEELKFEIKMLKAK